VFPLLLTRSLSTSLSARPRSVLITEQMLALLRGAVSMPRAP
jgi:hypothetical protein